MSKSNIIRGILENMIELNFFQNPRGDSRTLARNASFLFFLFLRVREGAYRNDHPGEKGAKEEKDV